MRQHHVGIAILRPGEIRGCLDRLRDRNGGRHLVAEPLVQLLGLCQHRLRVAEQAAPKPARSARCGSSSRSDRRRPRPSRRGRFRRPSRQPRSRQRIGVAADAVVDVARHMHDVAGPRHQRGELVGIGFGALRAVGGLHQVDVEVDRRSMVGSLASNAFQALLDVGRAALAAPCRPAANSPRAGCPCRPRQRAPQARRSSGYLSASAAVASAKAASSAWPSAAGIFGVARRDCGDQGLLLSVAPAASACALAAAAAMRRSVGLRIHRHIDIGSEHQRLAEEAHGAVGIEALGLS